MSAVDIRRQLALASAVSILATTVNAGSPVWTYSAPMPAVVSVTPDSTATVKYTVTNQSAHPKNLLLKATPGLSASPCYLATRGSTCTITLTIAGNALPASGIHNGPLFCNQGNINQCYQPNQANVLNVKVTKTVNPYLNSMATVGAFDNIDRQRISLSYYSDNNGKNWTISPTLPLAQTNADTLLTISCEDNGFCAAQGAGQDGRALSYYSNNFGKSWAESSLPPQLPIGATGLELSGIACNGSLCASVGVYDNGSGAFIPVSYYSNDSAKTWTISPTLPPSVSGSSYALYGISCNASGSCAAVGYSNSGAAPLPASYYSTDFGKNWKTSITQPALVSSAETSVLYSISCNANDSCTAVGYFGDSLGTLPVSYYSTDFGKNWIASATQPVPVSSTANSTLNSVSCNTNGSCAAVGSYDNGSQTVPLSYYSTDLGKHWTASTQPIPASNGENTLIGVVCKTSGSCAAVGKYNNGSKIVPLSYYSTDFGKHWALSAILAPTQAETSFLNSVS